MPGQERLGDQVECGDLRLAPGGQRQGRLQAGLARRGLIQVDQQILDRHRSPPFGTVGRAVDALFLEGFLALGADVGHEDDDQQRQRDQQQAQAQRMGDEHRRAAAAR